MFKQTRTIYVTKTNAVANKAVVQGTLYFDIDGNGAYTAGVDLPLANTAIVLRRTLVANNSNKKLLLNRVAGTGTQIGSTTTDANGVYKFTVDKYPGETLTIHISSTDAQVGSVTVDATGGSSGETVLAPSAIIQGNIWQDDGNGIFDVGLDIPLSSVVVDIRLETGEELVGSVTTDSDGHFGLVTVPYVSAAMKIVAGDGTVLASFATDETGAAVVDVPIGATTSPTLLVATTRRIVQTTKRVVKTTSKLVATTSKKPTTRPIIRTTSKRIVPTTSKKIIATTKAPVPTTKAAAVPTTKAVVTTTKAPAPLVTTAHVTRTVTPTMNPSNTILKAGCTYLPVPYELPTAGDTQSTVFNIELISCVSDASINAVFVTAAQRWMKIITGDLLDVTNTRVTMPIADCITDSSNVRMLSCGFVDDLIIGFSVFAIDGVGGTLAQALPLYSRPDSYASNPKLPISGYMEFDSADWSDLQSKGTLQTVVTHEMGHVLGFGTKWLDFSMLSPATCDTLTPPFTASFTGTNAIAALPLINYNGGSVPVEDTGGAGTSCGHWKVCICLVVANVKGMFTDMSFSPTPTGIDHEERDNDRDGLNGTELPLLTHRLPVQRPRLHNQCSQFCNRPVQPTNCACEEGEWRRTREHDGARGVFERVYGSQVSAAPLIGLINDMWKLCYNLVFDLNGKRKGAEWKWTILDLPSLSVCALCVFRAKLILSFCLSY